VTTERPVDRLLGKLHKVKATKKGWSAFCPAHEDRKSRSLSITEAVNGNALVHCFAGCAVDRILAAIGLRPADLFLDSPSRLGAGKDGPVLAGTWYTTGRQSKRDARPTTSPTAAEQDRWEAEARVLLAQGQPDEGTPPEYGIRRLPDRLFIPVHDPLTGRLVNVKVRILKPTGDQPKSFYGLTGAPGGLLGFDALRTHPGTAALICEGETDMMEAVRYLLHVGRVPVSASGGAGHVPDGLPNALKDRPVVLAYDADTAGTAGAVRVTPVLHAAGIPVTVVDLRNAPGGLITGAKDAKDLRDYFRLGGNAGALMAWMAGLPTVAEAKSATDAADTAPEETDPKDAAPERTLAPEVRDFTEIRPASVSWLWYRYIPFGNLTILEGDPGLSKSTMLLDIAARVTRGLPMPDGSVGLEAPGNVLVISAEDDSARTIRPRLEAAGADLARVFEVHVPTAEDEKQATGLPSIPGDIHLLEEVIRAKNIQFVILDPIVALLDAATDSWKDQSVRRALGPIKGVSERTGVATAGIRHLNKSGGSQAIYRGGGSIGISGAARSVLLVGTHPEDPTKRVLAPVKSNLSRSPDALVFEATGVAVPNPGGGAPIEAVRISWGGAVDMTANSLLAANTESAKDDPAPGKTAAVEFLRDVLRAGPVPTKAVLKEAREAGFSQRTLERARAMLGVKAAKAGMTGPWSWYLPAEDRHLEPKTASPESEALFVEHGGLPEGKAQELLMAQCPKCGTRDHDETCPACLSPMEFPAEGTIGSQEAPEDNAPGVGGDGSSPEDETP
jgi:hypothetical protein